MAALRFFFYLLMKPATLGMTFLGACGIFAPCINPDKWWIPALSGLFMPGIILVNLYLLVFWGIHKNGGLYYHLSQSSVIINSFQECSNHLGNKIFPMFQKMKSPLLAIMLKVFTGSHEI